MNCAEGVEITMILLPPHFSFLGNLWKENVVTNKSKNRAQDLRQPQTIIQSANNIFDDIVIETPKDRNHENRKPNDFVAQT